MNRFLKMTMPMCVLVALLLRTEVAEAAPLTCGAWNVVPSPNPGTQNNTLYGIAAVSANDVWTVGSQSSSGIPGQALIEHWDGTSWSVVSSPGLGMQPISLYSVVAVSANDAWAVGVYTNSSGTNLSL